MDRRRPASCHPASRGPAEQGTETAVGHPPVDPLAPEPQGNRAGAERVGPVAGGLLGQAGPARAVAAAAGDRSG